MTRTVSFFIAACFVTLAGCAPADESTSSPLVGTSSLAINDVNVEVDSAGLAMLTANATDSEGSTLFYNWGARGLNPPVISESQVVLDSAAVDPGQVTAHLVVQNQLGELVSAQVEFTPGTTCRLCGARSITRVPTPADEPCVILHDRCIAQCRAAANGDAMTSTCLEDCGVAITLCRTDPA